MPQQEQRRGRLAAFIIIAFAAFVAAISCQDARRAQVAKAPVTRPTAMIEQGTVRAEDLKAMGFSFAAAPSSKDARARTDEQVLAANRSCVACHATDRPTMHEGNVAGLTCVDCHGGRTGVAVPMQLAIGTPAYDRLKRAVHVQPRLKDLWKSPTGANPQLAGPASLAESVDYIRFINPGDLRAARAACASCHNTKEDGYIVDRVSTSMMRHGAMLWSAALYNNGSINRKQAVYGEFYTADGQPAQALAATRPTLDQYMNRGMLAQLFPLPRWEVTQPGNLLRVFERGGERRPITGLPDPKELPGRPDVKLSLRGLGTEVRTDPVFIGLQKTRLLDPTLNMLGTNDHPGDYRASGCTACHVVYANDRSPVHSTRWAQYGNLGHSFSSDITVNPSATTRPTTAPAPSAAARDRGHPIQHAMVRSMPTSSCISCHIHPGTNVVNSYLGYTWWDNESDGRFMYPKRQKYPDADQEFQVSRHNPEGAAPRGLWSNLYPNDVSHAGIKAGDDFLENLTQLNPQLKHTQFADFHGHGWVYRAVFKQDREGRLLDHSGNPVQDVTAKKMADGIAYQGREAPDHPAAGVPVHLKDIHLEKGMQCVDCHFEQDNHGDGHLYGETRNAVLVDCIDCHGTAEKPSNIYSYLVSSKRDSDDAKNLLLKAFTGNAAPTRLDDKALAARKAFVVNRFKAGGGKLVQKSAGGDGTWTIVQTADTVSPESWWAKQKADAKSDATLARYAHTVRRGFKDGQPLWGGDPATDQKSNAMLLAHANTAMSCYACHTSWNTSCFGCHLPMRANQRQPMLHNEAAITRNYTNYNYQTLRDDIYMLGIDSTVKQHKVVPVRSACAVLVSSQDANRQWIYTQQQTVSAEGFSGTAFSPYFPHTVRSVETKQCTDCHLSKDGDNNAIMAQVLLQGTNAVNFIGRFAWIAKGSKGLEAVAVTERSEPQAVIGSRLHQLAYPDYYLKHVVNGDELTVAHEHHGTVLDVQLRGEYLYAACGPEGFIAYDVANIDNKGFSERIITAPVSPMGQRFYVKSRYATSICSPSTMAIDPTRPHLKLPVQDRDGQVVREIEPNQEQRVHPLYAFLYMTDRDEGLIVIGNPLDEKTNKPGVATLLDGDPDNNFLQRALTYNPDGLLKGARHCDLYGHYAYISCDAGLVVLDLDNPLVPRVVAVMSNFQRPRKVAFQFRYGFVVDEGGIHVIDVTFPDRPQVVQGAAVTMSDARDLYICRTYGYVAAGQRGVVILNLTAPESPKIDRVFDSEGRINDATAIRVGMTNTSLFAYVADGANGLKVLQLTSEETPGYLGFSPRPFPRLIAQYHTQGRAIALSEGLDRDRAVDESGNQLSVFGRRGARPFNLQEQHRLYLLQSPAASPAIYTVRNTPDPKNLPLTRPSAPQPATTERPASAPPRPRPPRPGRR